MKPNLGSLNRVSAAMPIPQGMVEAEYSRVRNGFEAVISLPKGTSGELVWKTKTFAIREGKQTLTLD
jgi:hypothetical protein